MRIIYRNRRHTGCTVSVGGNVLVVWCQDAENQWNCTVVGELVITKMAKRECKVKGAATEVGVTIWRSKDSRKLLGTPFNELTRGYKVNWGNGQDKTRQIYIITFWDQTRSHAGLDKARHTQSKVEHHWILFCVVLLVIVIVIFSTSFWVNWTNLIAYAFVLTLSNWRHLAVLSLGSGILFAVHLVLSLSFDILIIVNLN